MLNRFVHESYDSNLLPRRGAKYPACERGCRDGFATVYERYIRKKMLKGTIYLMNKLSLIRHNITTIPRQLKLSKLAKKVR